MQQEEQDARLLQLLREDRVPVVDLLQWLHAHHGPGPPAQSDVGQTQVLPSTISMSHEHWTEQLAMTNPQSFAVSFLNYVRAEVQPLLAGTDPSGDLNVKMAVQPAQSDQTKELERGSDLTVASEPSKVGEYVLDFSENKGTRDRRRFSGTIQFVQEPKRLEMPAYEDDFPALGKAPSVNVSKKSAQSKQKRRVTPTPMVNPVVDSAFILAKVEPPITAAQNHSNKSRLPGSGPVKVDMDVLMQRCEKTRKQKQKEKPEPPKKEAARTWNWEKFDARSATTSNQGLLVSMAPAGPSTEMKNAGSLDDVLTSRIFPASTGTVLTSARTESVLAETMKPVAADRDRMDSGSSPMESSPPHILSSTLTNLAAVHSTLMVVKLVPSLLEELHFLLQLLSLEPAFSGAGPFGTKRALDSIAESKQEKEPVFCSDNDCAGYATLVLEQAGRILDCVGEQTLVALIEEPAIARHSATLLVRLKASLAEQQAAALRSFKAYEAASRTNSAIEHSPTAGTVRPSIMTPGLPVSLPFQAARDSRNIFKTQEEQRAYNNREQCRDHFYAIIREAASAYSAFGWISTGSESEGYLKMKDSVRRFLQVLLVENYPWFAELFLEQVLQVSNCGETDPEVTNLARQDPAKLQRLHDRLTSNNTVRLSAVSQKQGSHGLGNGESNRLTLSPSSPWSQVKNAEQRLPLKKNGTNSDFPTGNLQIVSKGRSTVGNVKERSQANTDVGSKFSSYFSQSLCVYVWFLEAADSHRLNTQMMWSIKGRITILTQLPPYSRDAADIGSGFTQRVLALQALAGLLGYLFVSPGAGARPPAPGFGTHDNLARTIWDVARSEPPVDVPGVLSKAQKEGSLLLNLPWVLDFLRLLKADWQAVSHPHFEAIISALRDVYLLGMLDPSSDQFGVGSICILASLDGFFEDMDLSPCNSDWSKKVRASVGSPVRQDGVPDVAGDDTRQSDVQAEERPLAFKGLDTMLGIIDSRYIQHCCPLLMDLRGVLMEGKKRRQRQREPNWPDSPGLPRARIVRKITPVQRPGPSQSLDISGNVTVGEKVATLHGSDLKDDQLKLQLQRTFVEQRPHLRRVVDFVVDTVAGNAARAAVLKLVPPALQKSQEKLQMVLKGNAADLIAASSPRDVSWRTSKGTQVETAVEHIITTTIQQLLGPALEYAKRHAADRTAEALAALADPEESSFVLGVAAGIAAETAGLAACQKALAGISGEIRKRITDDVETWRRKSHFHGLDRESRTTSSDASVFSTLQTHGGSPGTAGRRLRAQSWPTASAQELSVELADQLNNDSGQEVAGTSGRVLSAPIPLAACPKPADETSFLKGNSCVSSPQHLITDAEVHTKLIQTSLAAKMMKSSMAVKRQLSFSLKEQTNLHARNPTDQRYDAHIATERTDTRETLGNGDSHVREPSMEGTQISRCLVRSGSREKIESRPEKFVSVVDRMQEVDALNCLPSGVASEELNGPQILAERITDACSSVCFYFSVEPFRDENRHSLRQHLAVICVSLEGLLSRIQGATPAGGFDALVFNQDPQLQHTRFCEGASSPNDSISTSKIKNLQLRVERGLIRRSVALAVHLLLWDPSIVLVSFHSGEMFGTDMADSECSSQGSLRVLANGLPSSCSDEISSLASSTEAKITRPGGHGSTSFQDKEFDKNRLKVRWTLMHALMATWKMLVEGEILSTGFLLQELLTSWRWKLAMTLQPWQGFFEEWSAMVQKGVASIFIGLMGSELKSFSEDYEMQLCTFLSAMSDKNVSPEGGEISVHTSGNTSLMSVTLNREPNAFADLPTSSVRIERQGSLDNRTKSLAVGLAVLVLQQLPRGVVAVQNGKFVRSPEDFEGQFIRLQKLLDTLSLEELR